MHRTLLPFIMSPQRNNYVPLPHFITSQQLRNNYVPLPHFITSHRDHNYNMLSESSRLHLIASLSQRYNNTLNTSTIPPFIISPQRNNYMISRNGKRNGYGVYTYPNGDKYEGGLKNGKRNGYGVYTYPNGDKYDGEWKDDKTDGKGTYTHPNGDKYAGELKNGKRNGKGTYTHPNGAKYEGQWKDGEKNGYGVYTYPNGDKYAGEWLNGKKNGKGTYTRQDGEKYEGEWKDDMVYGVVTKTDANDIASLHYYNNNIPEAMRSMRVNASSLISDESQGILAQMLITNSDISNEAKEKYHRALTILDKLSDTNDIEHRNAINTIGQLIQATTAHQTYDCMSLLTGLELLPSDMQTQLHHPKSVDNVLDAIACIITNSDEKKRGDDIQKMWSL